MRKGFTLIELQAVIILMAIIVVISMPSIIEQMRKSEVKIRSMIESNVFEGTRSYIVNRPKEYKLVNGRTYCVSIEELIETGEISSNIFDGDVGSQFDLTDSVEFIIVSKDQFTYDIKSDCIGYQP